MVLEQVTVINSGGLRPVF